MKKNLFLFFMGLFLVIKINAADASSAQNEPAERKNEISRDSLLWHWLCKHGYVDRTNEKRVPGSANMFSGCSPVQSEQRPTNSRARNQQQPVQIIYHRYPSL